ncbi:MAG: GAF domain-containing protein, partial [Candidatus Methylomirabilales bacterium]
MQKRPRRIEEKAGTPHHESLSPLYVSSPELDRVLASVARAAIDLVEVDLARLWVVEVGGSDLILAAQASRRRRAKVDPLQTSLRFPKGHGLIGWMLEHRRPRYSPDLTKDPLQKNKAWVKQFGFVSQYGVPLLAEDEAIGALVVLAERPRTFNRRDRSLLQGFADHAAVAIRSAWLHARLARREQELATLFETARYAVASLSRDEVFPFILRSAADLLNCTASSLRLMDHTTKTLDLVADYNLNEAFKRRGHLVLGQGVMGRIALEGQPMTVEDVETDPLYHHKAEALQAGIRSMATVPLRVHEAITGVLSVYDKRPRRFSEAEVSSLKEFANLAALVMQRTQLYTEAQQEKACLATVLEINKKIGATTRTGDLLQTIVEEAARLLQVDGVGFRRLEGEDLVLTATSGAAELFIQRPRLKVGGSLSGHAVRENRPIVEPDVAAASLWPEEHRIAALQRGVKGIMIVPVRFCDQVIGVLNLITTATRQFTERDLDLATAFADQAGIALERTRLLQETQAWAEKQRVLADLSRTVTATLDLQHVFDLIIRASSDLLEAPVASLWTLEGDELSLRASRGLHSEARAHRYFRLGEGMVGWIAGQKQPVVITEFTHDPRVKNKEWGRAEGLHAFAGFPLFVGDRSLGVLTVIRKSPQPFQADEVELLSAFADQVAIAIENARLYQGRIRQHQELAALHTIASTVNQTLHLDALL